MKKSNNEKVLLKEIKKEKKFLIVGDMGYKKLDKIKNKIKKEHGVVFYTILDIKKKITEEKKIILEEVFSKVIFCDLSKPEKILSAVKDFRKEVVGVETFGDGNIKYLKKVIPFFDTLNPSESSLEWSNNKQWMRKLFHEYNESISPKFLEIDTFEGEKTIKKIEKKLEYPIMIKPTNICQSKLVTKNYHREELLSSLKNIYKKGNIVQRIRDDLLNKKDTHFQVLAEEFIEGNMYSIDGLVDRNGKIFCYPPVYVKTGKNAGYDDFFGYLQMTPTKLSKNHKSIKKIEDIIQKTIEALSLKNSHFHIELLKSDEDGWKVVEIAPRVGGFREYLYQEVYGFSVYENTILNKMGKKITFLEEPKSFAAVMKIFGKKEGVIKGIKGSKKINDLLSVLNVVQKKKVGERSIFAKNGGDPVFIIYLKNTKKGDLLGDIRKIEKVLEIII